MNSEAPPGGGLAGLLVSNLGTNKAERVKDDRPLHIKIKDWLEVTVSTSPFVNACLGISMLIVAAGVAMYLSAPLLVPLIGVSQ